MNAEPARDAAPDAPPASAAKYPYGVTAKLPASWRPRVEALAAAEDRPVGAWLRSLIRRALDAAERRERRQRTGR